MNIDFSLLLVTATVITGLIVMFDVLFLAEKRKEKMRQMEIDLLHYLAQDKNDETRMLNNPDMEQLRKKHMPIIVDYSRSLFPVFLLVLVIRSFFFEPYQIPSGSMLPTLRIGDFILVDKFSFGMRLPAINTKVFPGRQPEPGDVLVFRAPFDPGTNFIKRVVGVAGDVVEMRDNQLYINGSMVPKGIVPEKMLEDDGYTVFKQTIADNSFLVQTNPYYSTPDGVWQVPDNSYFVLGDNRGNSHDSRFWGFVPDEFVVGRAFYIWMYWKDFFSVPSFSGVGAIDDNF